MKLFVGALLILGQAEASSLRHEAKISPPLKDVASDKKFFGPPFPADYPEDKRPVVKKGLLNKLKSPDQPYPALQSKEDYDADYVKDENSDTGAWQAQFEYDRLRRKLAQEEADEKRAQDRADREGRDVDGAQGDADAAGRKASEAQKDADAAAKGEGDVKRAEDFDGAPSHEKLKELKKAVDAAEERLDKQKKAFEECERQLEAAKKELDDLKAKQVVMEQQLAADTKLWEEQKAVKLNLKKTRQTSATTRMQAAKDKLSAAEKVKAVMEKALAKEKAQHNMAQSDLKEKKASLDKVKQQLEAAQSKLQQLHGFKPVNAAATATKSGAGPIAWVKSLLR